MKEKNDYRLDSPIYLDYDVNKYNLEKPFHIKIMFETIKGHFEKHGFEKKGKTDEGFTIFEKPKKK